jgi:C1A family cysteine protease
MATPVPEPRRIQRFGWIPDLPDHRDQLYAASPEVLDQLPPSVDLRDSCPKTVYDQGHLGSCTANAIAAAFEFTLLRQGLDDFMPSRLFIYYNERARGGTIPCDSGAMIRDGIKSVVKQGVCDENTWPYDITRFAEQPPAQCYTDAGHNRAAGYQRVPRLLNQLKGCLAHGYPIVFGFRVYETFEGPEVARTGVVPMPGTQEQALGGHAVLAVGYDDATERFQVRNSWGTQWGNGGYFTMPYEYLTRRGLSSDFWAILQVT